MPPDPLRRSAAAALLVLAGEQPLRLPPGFAPAPGAFVLAADGGADAALDAGLLPQALVGDLDSVTSATLGHLREAGCEILDRAADQDSSDCEKALRELARRGLRQVDVLGFQGDRLDHQLCGLHAFVAAAAAGFDLRLVLARADAWPLLGPRAVSFAGAPGQLCSVLPLTPCESVELQGVRWPLRQARLALGAALSCSNELLGGPASLSLAAGAALLYLGRGVE